MLTNYIKVLFLIPLLSSCGVLSPLLPKIKQDSKDIPIPSTWVTRLNNGSGAHNWVKKFKDPSLTSLVNEALENNYSLKATALRINQLKALEIITKARQRPNLNGSASITNSGSKNDGDINESTPLSLSFSTGWEEDLWGRLKDQREQARLDTTAAKADYFSARLSLAGTVTSAYFNLLSARESLNLTEETLHNFNKSLRIIERNYKAGIPGVDALDVQFGRNNVTSAQRNVSEAKLNLARTSQALQILLGRYPDGSLFSKQELPSPISSLPNTLPQGVIEQRPDLISSRAQLTSLVKEVDIRQKALLPSISLSGRVSDSSVSITELLNPAFLAWSVASSLSQPLVDGGERKAAISQALIQHKIAIQRYSNAALIAFQEVEFALMADKAIAEQAELLKKEVRITTLAEAQAQRDYSSGLANARILSVLESQRRAVNARSSLIRIQNERLQNQVDLFLAVGGNP